MKSPGIAFEISVLADHSMTGHDNGNGVRAIGSPNVDSRARVNVAKRTRELAIAGSLTRWNTAQCRPNLTLKGAATLMLSNAASCPSK
jgi:hypothetical protein